MQLQKSFLKKFFVGALLILLVVGFSAGAVFAQQKTIKIGWVAWAETEPVAQLLRVVFEDLGYDVELILSDIGVVYTSVARGELDIGLEGWLPVTHEAYWEKFTTQIIALPMYENARLGWAVPDYIPEDVLSSVTDMDKSEVKRKLQNRIVGIDPGAGLMQHSELMIEEYPALKGYNLVPGSDAAMMGALKRAIQRKEWIVVTSWTPHVMWAAFSEKRGGPGLRYLEEPKKILGGEEYVSVLVGRKFYEELPPDITGFLSRMWFDISEINDLMFQVEQGLSPAEAAEKYIRNNPDKMQYWKTGEM
ncbi:MAG: glycine betaine ABC transporter substrate-binding protein [Spirochaetota bacterium]